MEFLNIFCSRLEQVTKIFSKDERYRGEVFPQKIGGTIWSFQERGKGPFGSFQNAWLWERRGDFLLLSKKRPNASNWQHLAQFFLAKGKMQLAFPYVCGSDIYAPEIYLEEVGFSLLWKIQGPFKKQIVHYCYY